MIVSVPFFPGLTDYDKAAASIIKQGDCPGHSLRVIVQRPDEEDAIAFKEELASLFGKAEVKTIEVPAEGGLVGLSNEMFRAAVRSLPEPKSGDWAGERNPNMPLLYLDPTWRPARTGWLDAIQSEYFSNGTPRFTGCWTKNKDGEKVPFGPVLIAPGYAEGSGLLAHLPPNRHWRNYLRYEIGTNIVASRTIGAGKGAVLRPPLEKK